MKETIKDIQNFILRQRINLSHKSYVGSHSQIRHADIGNAVAIGKYCNVAASSIGNGTYLGDNVHLPFCRIGKFCSIAHGVTLGAGNHPKQFVSMHPSLYSGSYRFDMGYVQKPFEFQEMSYADKKHKFYFDIGNDVWIATNALLISSEKCLKIGDGSIIGGVQY